MSFLKEHSILIINLIGVSILLVTLYTVRHLKNQLHLKKLSIIETAILLNSKITQSGELERFRIKAKIIWLGLCFLYFILITINLLKI